MPLVVSVLLASCRTIIDDRRFRKLDTPGGALYDITFNTCYTPNCSTLPPSLLLLLLLLLGSLLAVIIPSCIRAYTDFPDLSLDLASMDPGSPAAPIIALVKGTSLQYHIINAAVYVYMFCILPMTVCGANRLGRDAW